jgi:MscS family membrane protein
MNLRKRALAFVLAAGSLLAPSTVWSQDAPAEEPAAEEPVAQEPAFAGPQAVLRAFFDAMEAGDRARAAATFQEGAFSSSTAAKEAAEDLYYGVFLRTRRIDVSEEVPVTWGEEVYPLTTYPDANEDLTVTILFVRDVDGGFRISASTLESVEEMKELLSSFALSRSLLQDLSLLETLHHELRDTLPPALTRRGFILENWHWLGLLALTLLCVVLDRLVRFLTGRVATRVAKGRNVRLDPEVLLGFERPLGLLFGVVAFELFLPVLGVDAGIQSVLMLATGFVTAVAGVWAAYKLVDVVCGYLTEKASRTYNKFDDMLVPLLRRTLKLFVVVVGIVFVASRLSEDLWGIVAGLGLGSLAVGFAARDSIENLFGTFTVLLDKPFQIGDWVIVGDVEGTVETVGFRSTRFRTFYNSIITVPNRTFIATAIDNMGERRYRRIKTTLALTYDTPPEKVEAMCEGVREIIRTHPYTRKDYYHVYLTGLGASSLDVLLYAFVETPDWSTELREKHRLFADILRLAERLNVSFAFPTQTIHVARPEDLEHPDRPADDARGASRGREAARDVVTGSMEAEGGVGTVPPPVTITTRPLSGDDGADGG